MLVRAECVCCGMNCDLFPFLSFFLSYFLLPCLLISQKGLCYCFEILHGGVCHKKRFGVKTNWETPPPKKKKTIHLLTEMDILGIWIFILIQITNKHIKNYKAISYRALLLIQIPNQQIKNYKVICYRALLPYVLCDVLHNFVVSIYK